MKIGIVSSAYNNIKKNPNFTGLWGDEERKIEDDIMYDAAQNIDYGSYSEEITKPYYPFLDETDEYIKTEKEKAEKNIRQRRSYGRDYDDMVNRSYSTIIKVMPKIPITTAEYNAYIARELLSKQEMDVEDKLKGAHLQKFLNVPPKNINFEC